MIICRFIFEESKSWNDRRCSELPRRPLQGGIVFSKQLADPKSPATLDWNAPAHVQERRVSLQKPTLASNFNVCWKLPQQCHHPNWKGHPSEKSIRVHNIEIKKGAAWKGLSSRNDPHYNVSLSSLQHCPIIIQSVKPQAVRTFPKLVNGGQFQSSGCQINEEWAFTHMKWWLSKMWKWLDQK